MARWVMDKLSGNRVRRGSSPATHVVNESLDTLVRETLQNSKDQSLKKGGLVRVRYRLLELTGKDKTSFLKHMDWKRLNDHLEACTVVPGEAASKLRLGIDQLASKRPLICLLIEDFGARGLEGDEFEEGRNFELLCRAEFQTSDEPGRGGSYGLGKAVLWRFSCVSTVMLSSLVGNEEKKGLRIFGRTDIPSHKLENGEVFQSGGLFGSYTSEPDGPCAESIWADDTLAAKLFLDRAHSKDPGTTALIVGFYEPEEDDRRDLNEIADDIIVSAERWFWPAMTGASPRLEVEAVVEKGGSEVYSRTADPVLRWAPFVAARENQITGKTARDPGDTAETTLPFEITKKVFPEADAHPDIKTELDLRVHRGDDGLADHERANSVAIFRGAEMVVRYVEAKRKPLDDKPFFGVLLAGNAQGNTGKHNKVDEFFRASEPPLHDEWKFTTAVKSNYKQGSRVRLARLFDDLQETLGQLVEEAVAPEEKGPELLAKLFPLGHTHASQKKQTVKTRITSSTYNSGKWEIEGTTVCVKFKGEPWQVRVGFIAETDSGAGEYLQIKNLTTRDAAAKLVDNGPPAKVEVDGSIDRFDFRVSVVAGGSLEKKDLDLTAIRFSH